MAQKAIQFAASFVGDGTTTAFVIDLFTNPISLLNYDTGQPLAAEYLADVIRARATGITVSTSGVTGTVSTAQSATLTFTTAPTSGSINQVNFWLLFT